MKSLFRSAVIFAGTFAAAALSSAQPSSGAAVGASTNSGAPNIQFNTENLDSGKTIAGTPFRYTFQVTNAGDGLLEISNVHGNCGCTTVTWTTNIPPHQIGEIPIVVQTQPTTLGQIEKMVTVTSNDPKRPSVVLHVHILAWVPIQVTPSQNITFNIMPDGTVAPSQVLRIFNRTEEPLVLSQAHSDTTAFSAVLKTNVPGQEFELTISPGPAVQKTPSLGTTTMSGTIAMQTSSTNLPELKINATAVLNPEVFYYPNQIQLPRGALSAPSQTWIQVRDNTGRGLNLSDPAINVPGVDVSVKVMTTNHQYSFVVIFPPGFELPPGVDVVATVKTDNPGLPVIKVPVSASLVIPPPMLQQYMRSVPPGTRLTNGTARPFMPQQVNAPHP